MARKAHAAPDIEVDTTGPLPEGHSIIQADEAELNAIENDMAYVAGKLASRIETALFYETVSQKIVVESYIELKKNNAFRALTFKDTDGKTKNISSLDEFCEHFLKKSQRRVQQMANNYHLIGADLYDTAEQIGFRQKDYTALKALPAEDQDVIKQAMQADRDQVIDLLQEMAARHASEKTELTAKATEAEETARARSEVIASKEAKINSLEEANSKLKRRIATATPDEVGEQLRTETTGIGWHVVGTLNDDLNRAFEALDEHARANDCTHEEFMSGVLFDIQRAIWAIRERFAVKERPDGDARPDWTRDDFDPESAVTEGTRQAAERFEKEHGYNPLKQIGRA